jgi:hypothetical protein
VSTATQLLFKFVVELLCNLYKKIIKLLYGNKDDFFVKYRQKAAEGEMY